MHHLTTLSNGLRIVTAEIPAARSVSITVFIAAGSRHEPDRIQGVSHFIEHMLFKGTKRRPSAKEISEAIEGIGGICNAEAGKEVTVYWGKVAHRHWQHAFDVIGDLIRNSLFEAAEIEKERRVIVEELSMLADSPGDWVHLLADEVIWGGDQPLGRDIAGTKESVGALSRETMLEFVARHYVPINTVISVAGALSHDEVVAFAATALDAWSAGEPARWEPAADLGPGPRVALRAKDTEQAHFCLAVPAISYLHPDRFALDLLNILLGEGMSSRLFLEIREHRGLAYDVHSYVNSFRDTGSLVVYAGVDPGQIDAAVRGILEVIQGLAISVPEAELERAKEFWKGRTLLRLEDTRAIASWLGSQLLLLDEILTVDQIVELIDRVTTDDITRLADQLFAPGKLHGAVIGPYTGEERFVRLLQG